VGQEPEHLVPDGVAGGRRAGLLDHPGVVTAKDDRELVLDHALENPAGDEGVDGLTEDARTRTCSWSVPTSGIGRSSGSRGGESKLSRVKARIGRVPLHSTGPALKASGGPPVLFPPPELPPGENPRLKEGW